MKTKALKHTLKIRGKELKLYYYEENFWLTLNSMAEFFNRPVSFIYQMLKEIEKSSRINLKRFNKQLHITLDNKKTTTGNFFSFEILLAVAYKINPKKALELHKLTISSYHQMLSTPTKQKKGFMSILRGV